MTLIPTLRLPGSLRARLAGLFVLCGLLLAGCAPVTTAGQVEHTANLKLAPGGQVGQTFTTTYGGLQSLAVWVAPDQPGEGRLVFRLHHAPGAPVLREASINLADITAARYQRFRFTPLAEPAFTDYHLTIEIDGAASVLVGSGPGGSYADGAAYLDGEAQDAQLVFRPGYDPAGVLRDLLREFLGWIGVLLAGALLFIFPGWGLAGWLLHRDQSPPWQTRAALAAAISLAIYPLLFLLSFLLRIQPGALLAWLSIGFGAVTLLVPPRRLAGRAPIQSRDWLQQGLFGFVLACIVFSRFWAIRQLDYPMFGDSYQHSLITRLLLDHGGLFDTWLPYTDLGTFTYHFGFHSLAAVFAWVTRLQPPQAVLVTGQLINILAVFTIIPLALRIAPGRWTPIFALLVAGLAAPVPMNYTNWGRYPQLAGQVVLPVLLWLAWDILERREWRWPHNIIAGLMFTGLAVTHYRILIFGSIGFLTIAIFNFSPGRLKEIVLKGASMAVIALAGFLPWFVHVYAGHIMDILSGQLATPAAQSGTLASQTNNAGTLTTYLPAWLWTWMGLVILAGLLRRVRTVWIISAWLGLMVLAANPGWLNLPGEGAITNFAVLITFYIPAGVLCGASAGWLLEVISRKVQAISPPNRWMLATGALLAAIVVAAGSASLAMLRTRDIRPEGFSMVTRADLRAAAWIRDNLSATAIFHVNAFPGFGDYTQSGSDAGWWLPVLTGHKTTLPPTNYGFEEGFRPDYRIWTNQLLQMVQQNGIDSPDVLDELSSRGVTHVYIGQKQGLVNAPVEYALDPEKLLASPNYRMVYHQDRVWIFEIAARDGHSYPCARGSSRAQ